MGGFFYATIWEEKPLRQASFGGMWPSDEARVARQVSPKHPSGCIPRPPWFESRHPLERSFLISRDHASQPSIPQNRVAQLSTLRRDQKRGAFLSCTRKSHAVSIFDLLPNFLVELTANRGMLVCLYPDCERSRSGRRSL